MLIHKVVNSFLMHNGKLLILKRSQQVGTQRGKWSGVSGYLEESSALDQAYKEISEETGLQKADLTMQYAGDPIDIPDSQKDGVYWRVYPFLFIVTSPEKVVLDWEHDEMRWVDPSEVKNYDTVPDLCRVMKSVMSDL